MTPLVTARRERLPLGLLVVLAAVFLWGYQYKLSLYHDAGRIHSAAPPAKLLSETERPSSARATLVTTLKPQLKVALTFGLPPSRQVERSWGNCRALLEPLATPWISPCDLSQFLPRPPPLS